jgi:hypothetical protein
MFKSVWVSEESLVKRELTSEGGVQCQLFGIQQLLKCLWCGKVGTFMYVLRYEYEFDWGYVRNEVETLWS